MATRFFILFTVLITSLHNNPAYLSRHSSVDDVQIVYEFNTEITIQLIPDNNSDINAVTLFLQNSDQQIPQIIEMTREKANFIAKFSPQRYNIQPFSYINYWFTLEYNDNHTETTNTEAFYYYDNRIDWRKLEYGDFRIYWSEDNRDIAQKVLESAQQTVSNISNFLYINDIEPINIFIYMGDTDIFNHAIFTANDDVVAASTVLSSRSIIMHIPEGPDKYLEVQRQTPHEIAHILLADYLGEQYKTAPKWLHEGFASYNELLPNPDYPIILSDAYENDFLIPISQLCASFPLEENNFLLSYAESYDLVKFIIQQYGTDGLKSLIDAYRSTADCEKGVETALGLNLNQLNQQWVTHTFGKQPFTSSLDVENASWVILLGIVILPIILSGISMIKKAHSKEA